jgi:superfamily I DNA/RNA helicase
MRTPNPEQKLAIEHTGGVILKAGAGSGKTFVLVEHIVFLTQNFIEQNKDKAGEEFSRALSSYFSKIVLMTFTKKAAGELETRVRIRVKQLAENDHHWQLARDQLGHLNISTIHGFCHKLLTQGYITDLSPDIEILTEIEYKAKIENLIDDFTTFLARQSFGPCGPTQVEIKHRFSLSRIFLIKYLNSYNCPQIAELILMTT